jgi:ribosomal protein L40E
MSYCVNCGVQLNDQAKECPLCHTEVLRTRPAQPSGSNPTPNLEKEMLDQDFDRSLWIKLITITLLTPAVLSILINWIFKQALDWSLYVAAGMIFVWIWSISVFFFKKNRFLKWLPIAWASLIGFLFVIENLTGSFGWFFSIGVPITTSLFIIVSILALLIKNNWIKELQIPASIFLGIGLFCFSINGAISFYKYQVVRLNWSLIVMITCVAFALIGFVLQRRPWIVEKIKHWFRV